MDATTLGLIVVVGLLPALPLRLVSNESLARARDFWLLLMLAAGTIWAAVYIPPFWPIGIFFLWHWRSRDQLPSLVTWACIAVFFWGVSRVPAALIGWVPFGWLAIGVGAVAVLAVQWWRLRPQGAPIYSLYRPFHGGGIYGQRTVAACVFALMLPFAPWWAMPIPVLGLLITSSWAAWIAALAAAIVRWG